MSSGRREGPPGGSGEDVGSVSDEAAKLIGALSGWARDHGVDLDRATATAQGVADHVDTGAPECSWCPVCRTVHLVRAANPEVRDHLAAAATSLMQAAAGFLAAAGAPQDRPQPGVEHIDLDADPDAHTDADRPGTTWPEEER